MSTRPQLSRRRFRTLGMVLTIASSLMLAVAGDGVVATVHAAMSPQETTTTSAQQTTQTPPEPEPASPEIPEPPRFVTDVVATLEDTAGDLFFWGQSGTIVGRILNNAFIAGQIVSLDGGSVGGDLFLFGATATVDGEVSHDVYAFASQIRVSDSAVVNGNLVTFAGSVRIDGTVRGKLLGSGGIVVINGNLGSADIEAGTLRIGPRAHIAGDLEYRSDEEPTIDPDAVIDGQVRRKPKDEAATAPRSKRGRSWWSIAWKLWRFVGTLVLGFALLLLGGPAARMPALCLRKQPAPGLGLGFVVTVVTPVACVLAIVLIVSLPLGVVGLVAFALAAVMARLVSAQFLGDLLLRRLRAAARPNEYLSFTLGLLVLALLAEIPYVGFLTWLASVVLGIGGIYLALRAAGLPSSAPVTGTES